MSAADPAMDRERPVVAALGNTPALPRQRCRPRVLPPLDLGAVKRHTGSMETTIGTPEGMLKDARRHAGARTKREAIVTAVSEDSRRRRTAALARYLGTCADLMSPEELQKRRSDD